MSRVLLRGGHLIRRKPDHFDGFDKTLAASKIVDSNLAWREREGMARKLDKARRDRTFWERMKRIARDKGIDLEEALGRKYLELLNSDEARVSKATADTLMNIRGNEIGKFDHIAPQNYKVEVTDNRVPETVAGISLEVLRKAVMGEQKLLEMEGDIEDAEFSEDDSVGDGPVYGLKPDGVAQLPDSGDSGPDGGEGVD